MKEIKQTYKILLQKYGYQNWWPTTPPNQTRPTYHPFKKTEKEILEIIFGAILAQNTSWKNVEKVIVNLNKANLIRVDKIIKTEKEKLIELIRPAGYYNQKAERLKSICYFLRNNPLPKLKKIKTEKLREILLSIKGIGPETADSILLYALKRSVFVVDAYTKRIFHRIGLCSEKTDYHQLQKLIVDNSENSEKIFKEYHALLVKLGKEHCQKKPFCDHCPLASICKRNI